MRLLTQFMLRVHGLVICSNLAHNSKLCHGVALLLFKMLGYILVHFGHAVASGMVIYVCHRFTYATVKPFGDYDAEKDAVSLHRCHFGH